MMETHFRSAVCGEVNENKVGQTVKLAGWADSRRDLGGVIFVDLRDRSGKVQVVFNEKIVGSEFPIAEKIRDEYVLNVEGVVQERTPETVNPKMETGKVEVMVNHITILDTSATPPIYVKDDDKSGENVRLKYRYLDLRKPKNQKILMTRDKVASIVRN